MVFRLSLALFFMPFLCCMMQNVAAENSAQPGFSVDLHSLPEPYRDIELLPFDPRGWFRNASQLEELILSHNVKTIIEVGSWLGASARFMASLLPKGGKLYAVDHWLGSIENQEAPDLNTLYQRFLSNVIHAKLTDKIVPVRLDSLIAAEQFHSIPCSIDLIYIDASHDEESVYKDLVAWYPFVEKKGILCGDDWCHNSVRAAVTRFAREKELFVIPTEAFWRIDSQPRDDGTRLKNSEVSKPSVQEKPGKRPRHKNPKK